MKITRIFFCVLALLMGCASEVDKSFEEEQEEETEAEK